MAEVLQDFPELKIHMDGEEIPIMNRKSRTLAFFTQPSLACITSLCFISLCGSRLSAYYIRYVPGGQHLEHACGCS